MLLVSAILPAWAMARDGSAPKESSLNDPFVLSIILIMLLLLLVIALLANVVIGAAAYYYEKEKERAQQKNDNAAVKVASLIGLLLFTAPAFAQDATAVQQPVSFNGLSQTAFYFLMGGLTVEVIVIFVLLYYLRVFLSKEKLQQQLATATVQKVKPTKSWWDKMNSFRPVEQEAIIDLGHDYDGIRELDNRLPPWWLYGFYLTIIFAGIYLWRYHVSHSAPSSEQEFQAAMQLAEEQKAAYLAKDANNVDENTVTFLPDAAAISSGQGVYAQNCSPCHGKAGEGTVGPNLTDDYWLHGGSVKDIFKTIKYGWPEKGMRSWKEDLSPVQIAQLTSYIKTLHGSNPPNGKEKQGELYKDENPGTNTSKPDSTINKLVQQ